VLITHDILHFKFLTMPSCSQKIPGACEDQASTASL